MSLFVLIAVGCAAGLAATTLKRHLKLEGCPLRVGLPLKFDPAREKFIDAPPEADKMLTRPPRKPFDVPETA